jgi:undecaprenyl-diphosphatase
MGNGKRRLNLPLALVIMTWLIAAIGVMRLAVWVTQTPVTPIDQPVSLLVQRVFSPVGSLMESISVLGFTPISQLFILSVAASLWVVRMRRAALVSLVILPNGLVSYLLKMLVSRPRPTDDLVQITRYLDDMSFPSGHVIMYTALFGFLIFVMVMNSGSPVVLRVTVLIVSGFMVLTVGISRIYLGAHWITDVMGGYLIGLNILSLLIAVYGSKGIMPGSVNG